MTDQNPEVPQDVVEAELEPTETAVEPEADTDADIVEAEIVGLDLGDEAPAAPVGTDFEVGESVAAVTPPVPSAPPADPTVPAAPTIPVSPPPTGGSFLDLPPLPDLTYPAPKIGRASCRERV